MGENSDERDSSLFNPDQATRRRFRRALAASRPGVAGLAAAVQRARGDAPDGVPVVRTVDTRGRPRSVTFVSKERYRRLQLFARLDLTEILDGLPVRGIAPIVRGSRDGSGTGQDELGFKVYLERLDRQAKRKLPNRVRSVPLVYEARPRPDRTLKGCRSGQRSDTLQGNIQVGGKGCSPGTLSVVAWRGSVNGPFRVAITAAHVIADANTDLFQPSYCSASSRRIATKVAEPSAHDVVALRLHDDVVAVPLRTREPRQPDIRGAWTFSGLVERTIQGEPVSCSFAGAETWYAEVTCTEVERTIELPFTARMTPSRPW
jgi:hypothetical protein